MPSWRSTDVKCCKAGTNSPVGYAKSIKSPSDSTPASSADSTPQSSAASHGIGLHHKHKRKKQHQRQYGCQIQRTQAQTAVKSQLRLLGRILQQKAADIPTVNSAQRGRILFIARLDSFNSKYAGICS